MVRCKRSQFGDSEVLRGRRRRATASRKRHGGERRGDARTSQGRGRLMLTAPRNWPTRYPVA